MDREKNATESLKKDRELLTDIQAGKPLPTLESEKHEYKRESWLREKIDDILGVRFDLYSKENSSFILDIIKAPFCLLYLIALVLVSPFTRVYRKLRRTDRPVFRPKGDELGVNKVSNCRPKQNI